MKGDQSEFIPTRNSLVIRLKDLDDGESWRDFFEIYWKLIYGVARSSGLSDEEAQEVVQETIITVAKTMPEYRYQPKTRSFKGWLHFLTKRRIADHYRKKQRQVETQSRQDSDDLEAIPDEETLFPEEQWELEWKKNLANAAIASVKKRLPALSFQIFDCSSVKGWSPKETAEALQVSVPKVYLTKHRVTKLIKREIERLRKEIV